MLEVHFLQEGRYPKKISCCLIVNCSKGIMSNNENCLVLSSSVVAFHYLAYDFG